MVEMGKYWYRRARHKMPSAYLVQTITRIECDRNMHYAAAYYDLNTHWVLSICLVTSPLNRWKRRCGPYLTPGPGYNDPSQVGHLSLPSHDNPGVWSSRGDGHAPTPGWGSSWGCPRRGGWGHYGWTGVMQGSRKQGLTILHQIRHTSPSRRVRLLL